LIHIFLTTRHPKGTKLIVHVSPWSVGLSRK